ncbi:MAG: hypothetical protein A2W19_09710 [Spirochaetes bacterium RBG_16_49_21]|nr:MAG: hypothetical protein A2W19_09710 [Spirochaetes bacterium RBG_16_49_21]
MHNTKRLIVATLSGLIFGFVCLGLASSGPVSPPWPVAAQIVISRSLIGVAIGISSIALGHWSIHGLVMGMLFSLPLAFSGLMAPDNPEFSKSAMFVWIVVLGMIYGLLIELIATVLFKAKQHP